MFTYAPAPSEPRACLPHRVAQTQTAELKRLAESSASSSTARHEAEAALAELEAQRDRALDESAAMRGQLTVAKEEAVRQVGGGVCEVCAIPLFPQCHLCYGAHHHAGGSD